MSRERVYIFPTPVGVSRRHPKHARLPTPVGCFSLTSKHSRDASSHARGVFPCPAADRNIFPTPVGVFIRVGEGFQSFHARVFQVSDGGNYGIFPHAPWVFVIIRIVESSHARGCFRKLPEVMLDDLPRPWGVSCRALRFHGKGYYNLPTPVGCF